MPLLKLFKDINSNLTNITIRDGQLLLSTDTGKLYIDTPATPNASVERLCVNPNADWNALQNSTGYIKNKPNFPLNISINEDKLIVQTCDGVSKASTIVEVKEYTGVNGDFVVMGNVCKYVLKNEYTVNTLTSMASAVLETIPSAILPKYTINHSALTSSAQLSDSIIIIFDTVTNKILVNNRSSDILNNITLLPTTYDYLINNYSRIYNQVVT